LILKERFEIFRINPRIPNSLLAVLVSINSLCLIKPPILKGELMDSERMLMKKFKKFRSEILTLAELSIDDDATWKRVRSKLLGKLGMNGFEKELLTFLKGEICERANK
jgi:hypothetical protein